jgi:uncharacterized membrane protein
MREWVEWSSQGIQAMAVVIIVISIVFGSLRFLLQLSKRLPDPYRAYREVLGRSLLLSLEFLVAADVIRTVLLDLTAKGMEILAALVAVRTFLGLSLIVELKGHWPWHSAELAAESKRVEPDAERKRAYTSGGLENPDRWAIDVPAPPTINERREKGSVAI